MSDECHIVKGLRAAEARGWYMGGDKAADEIERLRAELDENTELLVAIATLTVRAMKKHGSIADTFQEIVEAATRAQTPPGAMAAQNTTNAGSGSSSVGGTPAVRGTAQI